MTHTLRICPACGASGATDVDLGEGQHLRRCTACSLTYAPEYADPSELYREGYFGEGCDFGIDVSNPRFQRYLTHVSTTRARILEGVLGGRRRLLDVGCGTGDFLAALQTRGWPVEGVEPIEEAADEARSRGLQIHTGLLQDVGLPERTYDVVSAMHVLEHMADATEFLRLITRWARPGGHVAIEVPNFRSFHRKSHASRWPSLRPLEHIVHFSPATLESTLRRAGLEPVVVRTRSYLWREHTVGEMLIDLGRHRWLPVLDRLPAAPVRLGLGAVARAYDAAKTGMVILAVARVPGG